jgi:small subunit ribosomal protein S1
MDAPQETRESKDESVSAASVEDRNGENDDAGSGDGSASTGGPSAVIQVEEVEDFGAVLASFEAGLKAVKEGEVVSGRVLKLLEKEVIVDIGYKSEGIIALEEFRGTEINVGDRVDVLLEKTEDGHGYVVLSKEKAERLKIWDTVEKAYETGEPVVGRVIERIKGGLKVDIGLPAFLPGSLVDSRPVRHLESLIGKEFRMKVIKVNKRRGNIVLSRKSILDVENATKKADTLANLEENKILRGVVKNLTEYGAFIDLGGIDGLLHITDISWGRISHPSEKFQIGDELDVVVLKFDREKERVSLGFKQLQDDPWEYAASKFPPQARIRGKVVSLTDYGAFVEVEEGI